MGTADASVIRSLVGFSVAGVGYAVPTHAVRAVEAPAALTALPQLPPGVAGVYEYRGQVVPILDLRVAFEVPDSTRAARPKWIIVETGRGGLGLVVDGVSGVFNVPARNLEPVPNLGVQAKAYHVEGVTHHAGTLTFVLELDSFHEAAMSADRTLALHGAAARQISASQGPPPTSADPKASHSPRDSKS